MKQKGQTGISILTSLFLSGCGHLFFQPNQHYYWQSEWSPTSPIEHRWKVNSKKENQEIELLAWEFPPLDLKKEKGILIQFHGNAENRTSHAASLAWITAHQYRLIIFDYRGYGGSTGVPTAAGLVEDSIVALKEAIKIKNARSQVLKAPIPLIAIGQSLGGLVLLRALGESSESLLNLDALILESTFLSYQKIGRLKLQSIWLTWPLAPLAWVLVSDQWSAENSIELLKTNSKLKTWVLHDRLDPVVPFQLGQEIYDNLPFKDKVFTELNNKGHAASFYPQFPKNREQLLHFLSPISRSLSSK